VPLSNNTITVVSPRHKRYLVADRIKTMGLLAGTKKQSRLEKSSSDEKSKSRPSKAPKRLGASTHLNQAPSQRLDVYVFGSGESGELGLGHLKRNGKVPTNVKRPRLNDLLDAETVGVIQLDVGGMREFHMTLFPTHVACELYPSSWWPETAVPNFQCPKPR
jgi:regulator of chromosome condensation